MLDPQARDALDLAAKAGRPAFDQLTPEQARAQFLETRRGAMPPNPPVALVQDLAAPGPHGAIPLRMVRPHGAAPSARLPALVWFHGGGWVLGDLDSHEGTTRMLANASGAAVIAVDYRRPPEDKFPAAVEDAYAATQWIAAEADRLMIDRGRLAVGGDSAGGNLAAVVALLARDAGGPALRQQVLVYPVTDLTCSQASYRELGTGYGLTAASMVWFIRHYLRQAGDAKDWRGSPLFAADLGRLPPAFVVTAGFDPLRDEGRAYAAALARAGTPAVHRSYDGMIHGFIGMARLIDAAHELVNEIGGVLRRALR